MQHTQNYQLSRWEKDDRIMMEDFNADNEKIDAALKANADAVSALEVGKADAAALSEETSARTAADSTLAARVTALEQGVKLVRLGTYTTAAFNQEVTFDLQSTDMSEYAALLLFISAPKLNSTTGKLYLTVNGENLLLLKVYDTDAGSLLVWLQDAGGTTVGGALNASSGGSSIDSHGGSMTAQWTQLQSVGVNGPSAAGMTCTLYGFKG
ncbi:MAG: hypothetical protein PUC93_01145 [Oscillospiraceae bacterium]|nr:hypothetical protein [Oscillospiraceae bacterium]